MFELEIGSVSLLLLIPGIVECLKEFGVSGKGNIVVSLVCGLLFFGIGGAIQEGLLVGDAVKVIELIVYAIAGALSVSGYYRIAKRAGGALNGN